MRENGTTDHHTVLTDLIFHRLHSALVVVDHSGEILEANQSAASLLNAGRHELIGQPIERILLASASQSDLLQFTQALNSGYDTTGKFDFKQRDTCKVLEYALYELDGMRLLELKHAELKVSHALIEAEKMGAIGRMAGKVAHDLNNYLTGMLGYAFMASESLPDDNPAKEDLAEAIKAAEQARTFTQNLVTLGDRVSLRIEPIEMAPLLESVQAAAAQSMPPQVRLDFRLPSNSLTLNFGPGALLSIVTELISNATESMPEEGGQIVVAARPLQLDLSFARRHEIEPGHYAQIAVQDTGCGMDVATKERAFEPFFSTRERAKAGFGLCRVFQLIKRANGLTTLVTEPGQGTTVNLYIPLAFEPAAEVAPPTANGNGTAMTPLDDLKGSETVLLVEDQEDVRRMGAKILSRLGYQVIEAEDGVDGLNRYRTHGNIAIIVSDVIMPNMSGPEMIDTLREEDRDLKCMFVSGYAREKLNGSKCQDVPLVMKPYTRQSIGRQIREVLDGPAVIRA